MTKKLTLVSFRDCPDLQKAWDVLDSAGLAFEYTYCSESVGEWYELPFLRVGDVKNGNSFFGLEGIRFYVERLKGERAPTKREQADALQPESTRRKLARKIAGEIYDKQNTFRMAEWHDDVTSLIERHLGDDIGELMKQLAERKQCEIALSFEYTDKDFIIVERPFTGCSEVLTTADTALAAVQAAMEESK